MTLSRRPLVEASGSTWLGDPGAADFAIEVGDDAVTLRRPSGTDVVPWAEVEAVEARIPTGPWWLARIAYWVLSTVDAAEGAASGGAHSGTSMRRGQSDIELVLTRGDGTQVSGWAAKHQPFGYPGPEARAAAAVLRGRARRGSG